MLFRSNRAAYTLPAPFTFGNAANFYDDVRNPPFYSENISIIKRIPFRESVNAELRADMYNLFNRTLFGNINTNLGDPNFGRPTGPQVGARIITMGVRLDF